MEAKFALHLKSVSNDADRADTDIKVFVIFFVEPVYTQLKKKTKLE